MSQRRIRVWALSVLVAVGWLGMPGAVRAQGTIADEGALPPDGTARELSPSALEPRTFGTSLVVHTIQAFGFIPKSSTLAYTTILGGLVCVGVPCSFVAPVLLPGGAVVTAIEGDLCDTDLSFNVQMLLNRTQGPGSIVLLADAASAGMPGCVRVKEDLFAPETIDNQANSYYLEVRSGPNAPTSFSSIRLFYTLQVSPAPAVASFNDVPPTHPFFRFIEALKASGITGGCSAAPPLFCPDAPLTRGQMATFLSLALGLHFAP